MKTHPGDQIGDIFRKMFHLETSTSLNGATNLANGYCNLGEKSDKGSIYV